VVITGESFQISPYDPLWPVAFEQAAAQLRGALGATAVRIDHHGSTSVPGLAAKPIIDIQVSVESLQPMSAYALPLQSLGYVHVPDPDDSRCPFFHRPSEWPHTHHVHVVEAGGVEERRTIAFRDYLREHGDAAAEYERLKRSLAARLAPRDRDTREAYALAKSAFIERIVTAALSGDSDAGWQQRSADADWFLKQGNGSDRRIGTKTEPPRSRTASPRVRCPLCQWQPEQSSRWCCDCVGTPEPWFESCGAIWNTFDTHGRCPGCGHQWRWTTCLRCAAASPHEDWYEETSE
jgi:GrpB-like predicted nucleotidyltransferase (UPF0157 family)